MQYNEAQLGTEIQIKYNLMSLVIHRFSFIGGRKCLKSTLQPNERIWNNILDQCAESVSTVINASGQIHIPWKIFLRVQEWEKCFIMLFFPSLVMSKHTKLSIKGFMPQTTRSNAVYFIHFEYSLFKRN